MSRFAKIISTQESLEEQQLLAGAEGDVEAAETATQVAEATGDVTQDVTEIEAVDTGIDDAENAQDTIAELTGVAEASLAADGEQVAEGELGEDGDGMTQTEAAVVEITHESIMRSLGFEVERRTYTPESFNDKKSSRQVTLEALDGLKESAKKVGSGIMKALKAAFEMVLNLVNKIINNRALMERHLNNLTKRLAEAKDGVKKEKVIKAGAPILTINGKGDASSAQEVLSGLSHCLDISIKTANVSLRGNPDTAEMAKAAKGILEELKNLPKNGEGQGVLGGGKAFAGDFSKGVEELNKIASNPNTEVERGKVTISTMEVGGTKDEMLAPSKQDMSAVLAAAKNVLGKLRSAEAVTKKWRETVAGIIKIFSSMREHYKARDTERSNETSGKVVDTVLVAVFRGFLSKFLTTVYSHSFKAVKAAADYVSAGLRNMGDNGDESAAPAAN